MKNYSILTTIITLPTPIGPSQSIVVSLPNNAIPLQVEYRPGVSGTPSGVPGALPSCAIHYLIPCDEKGNPIEEVITPSIYEAAWNELYKLFGERLEQDNLDVMKAVMVGVMTVKEEEEKQRKGE